MFNFFSEKIVNDMFYSNKSNHIDPNRWYYESWYALYMGHGLHSTSCTIKHLRNSSLYTSTLFVEPHATPVTANPLFRAIAIPNKIPHFGHVTALSSSESFWKESHYLLLNLYERNHLHHVNSTTDAKLQGHHQFLSLEYYSSLI